jgi:hypothetical protein
MNRHGHCYQAACNQDSYNHYRRLNVTLSRARSPVLAVPSAMRPLELGLCFQLVGLFFLFGSAKHLIVLRFIDAFFVHLGSFTSPLGIFIFAG